MDCDREDVDLESLKINVKLFISKVKQKYVKSSRHFDRLLKMRVSGCLKNLCYNLKEKKNIVELGDQRRAGMRVERGLRD